MLWRIPVAWRLLQLGALLCAQLQPRDHTYHRAVRPKLDDHMAKVEQHATLSDSSCRLEPTSPATNAAATAGVDRERLLNDILNTGVMGALIGGFALSNMQQAYDMNNTMHVAIYMCSFVAVHACTCSAVSAALLYRVANALSEDQTPRWAAKNATVLKMPILKFGLGCLSYLLSVVLVSWRDLQEVHVWQIVALIIGLMSMSMTLGVAVLLGKHNPVDVHQLAKTSDVS